MASIQQVMLAIGGAVAGPGSITGLRLWLKAGSITGLNDNDQVTSNWPDSSGNGNDARPQGVTVKPRWKATGGPNSQPAVNMGQNLGSNGGYFDFASAASTIMGSPAAGHGFAVVKIDADPPSSNGHAAPAIAQFGSSTDEYYTFPSDSKIYDGFGSSARKTTVNPTPSLTSWRLYESRSAANDWSNWLDGTQLFSTASNTVSWNGSRASIGNTNTNSKTMDGLIAEVIVYDKILSAGELTTIKTYIADKYGLTLA